MGRWTDRREEDARVFHYDVVEVDDAEEMKRFLRNVHTAPQERNTMVPHAFVTRNPRTTLACVLGAMLAASAFAACIGAREGGIFAAAVVTLVFTVQMLFTKTPQPLEPAPPLVATRIAVRVDTRGIVVDGSSRGGLRVPIEEVAHVEAGRRLTLVRVDGTRVDLPSRAGRPADHEALAEAMNEELRALRAARGGYR